MDKRYFPAQKKLHTNKTKAWRESHVAWAKQAVFTEDSFIRTSMRKKDRNIKSYLGFIDLEEYRGLFNPQGLKKKSMPEQIQHHPIAAPYLNVLIGEEFDRRFEWRAICTNPNTLSQIEEDKKALIAEAVKKLILDTDLSPEEATARLEKQVHYVNFEYQDIREKRANLLLRHWIKELELKIKFNAGFKDVLLNSEEGYIGDVINGRPFIEKLDQSKVFIIRSGNSNRYEDADVIIIYDYKAPGYLQDKYYKFLSEGDTKWLDEASSKMYGSNMSDIELDEYGVNFARREMVKDYLSMPAALNSSYSSRYSQVVDEQGNVREMRVFWKSKKMIYRVKTYDEITGKPIYKYEGETYIANKTLGEEAEKHWVSQWWEASCIGEDIYPFIKPRDIQFNKFDDPGYNHPGIVGQCYSISSYRPSSMMDMAMPYQLIYDATFHRLQSAMSKFFGSLVVVDYASLPAGWDVTKWIYFAEKAGIAVKDSFKEGNKGMSTGKLAGGMPTSGQVINQQLGDYIQQQINILNYVEQQMGRIVGVPPQRLGDIQNRETVGGVERAVTQSSYITNERFKIHDNVKKRVLTMLLELCKVAYKNNPTKFQYISDTYVNQIFEIDDDFCEEDYGIMIDNESDLNKLESVLEQSAQAAIQAQTLRYSDLFKIYNSSSLSEKQRIIEKSETDAIARQEEAQKAQQEQLQAELQQKAQAEQELLNWDKEKFAKTQELNKYKIDEDNLTRRLMGFSGDGDKNNDGIADPNQEINQQKIELEYEKLSAQQMKDMLELAEKMRSNKANEVIKAKAATAKRNK